MKLQLRTYLIIILGVLVGTPAFAQWHSLNGPYGGGAHAFVEIAGSNGASIFAATPNGIYHTTDHAQPWQPSGLQDTEIFFLLQLPQPADVVLFAATHNRVYRSLDSGHTWSSALMSTDTIGGLIQDGTNCYAVLVDSGMRGGILRTTDIGKTWQKFQNGPSTSEALSSAVWSRGYIIETRETQIWRVAIAGGPWQQGILHSLNFQLEGLRKLTVAGETVLAAGVGVYVSTDHGANWLRPNNSGIDTSSRFENIAVNGLTMVAEVRASDNSRDVYRSSDGAGTWALVDSLQGYSVDASGTEAVTYIDNKFFAGPNGGIWTSPDGNQWTFASAGEQAVSVIDVMADDTELFTSTQAGIFRSLDEGQTWSLTRGTGNATVFHRLTDGTLINGSHKWTGQKWVEIPIIGQFVLKQDSSYFTSFHATSGSPARVLRSSDLESWMSIGDDLPLDTTRTIGLVNNGNELLALLDIPDKGVEVYATNDEGNVWSYRGILSEQGHPNARLEAVTVRNGSLYVSDAYALSISDDEGKTWGTIGLPATFLTSTGGHVLASNDSGLVSATEPTAVLLPASVTPSYGFTTDTKFAFTSGKFSVWADTLADLPLAVSHTDVLSSTGLGVYPNPAREKISITFDLKQHSHITLELYDALGSLRETVLEGEREAGANEIPFITKGLSNGVYTLIMSDGINHSVARLIIER